MCPPDDNTHEDLSEEARQSQREEQDQDRERMKTGRHGLVIVNTGKGKGKSTAAFGTLMRAWGRDFDVSVIQFIKRETGNWGEVRAAEKMNIEWLASGKGFTWTSDDIDRDEAKAQHGWDLARERIVAPAEELDIVLLDEFTYVLHYNWLDFEDVRQALDDRPDSRHVIITGRNASDQLIEYADLVTEMNAVKHPYQDQDIRAQPGIEY